MICEGLDGMKIVGSYRLDCASGLVHDLTSLVAAVTILVILAWALWQVYQGRFARTAVITVLMVLAALSLALASGQPSLVVDSNYRGGTVVAVIDASQSAVREDGAFRRMVATAGGVADKLADRLDREVGDSSWNASIIRFAEGAESYSAALSLRNLGEALRQMSTPTGGRLKSDAAAGLRLARERIRDSGGSGMILMIGDGKWPRDDLRVEVTALQQAGIPVYIIAGGSNAPGSGIVAADISHVTEIGAPTILRLVIRANEPVLLSVRDDLGGNPIHVGSFGEERQTVPVRIEQIFERRGLRFVDMILTGGGLAAEGGSLQSRRQYTLVKAPPRVLVFGPAPWAEALPGSRVSILRGDPLLPPDDLSVFDVIVIDGLEPVGFLEGFPQRLTEAAAGRGQGVLIANGSHSGGSEASTTIERWEETVLGTLLPVSADMRQLVLAPPARDLVMIFDTSGSMSDGPLATAKAMAVSSLGQLRPIDRLSIVNFSGRPLFMDQVYMTPENQARAESIINGLFASGGSDASSALDAVADPSENSCAVFFFTDGEISGVDGRSGCVTTVIGFGSGATSNARLARLGEIIQVNIGDDPSSIRTEFLEPDIREERWRDPAFTPLMRAKDMVPLAPGLSVPGIAITYPRPEAVVISVHPDAPPDPVLAFREDLRGIIGAFTGDISRAWGGTERGRMAILAVLESLSGWREIDRYGFTIQESDSGLLLSVSVFQKDGLAIPSRIEMQVVLEGEAAVSVDLRPIPGQRGQFRATTPIPYFSALDRQAMTGMLFLTEAGKGSLSSMQRIPIRLPARGAALSGSASGEMWHFGVDAESLSWLALSTGGQIIDAQYTIAANRQIRGASTPLHSWLLALCMVCFTIGIIVGGGRQ
jgi:hypothetical protein